MPKTPGSVLAADKRVKQCPGRVCEEITVAPPTARRGANTDTGAHTRSA